MSRTMVSFAIVVAALLQQSTALPRASAPRAMKRQDSVYTEAASTGIVTSIPVYSDVPSTGIMTSIEVPSTDIVTSIPVSSTAPAEIISTPPADVISTTFVNDEGLESTTPFQASSFATFYTPPAVTPIPLKPRQVPIETSVAPVSTEAPLQTVGPVPVTVAIASDGTGTLAPIETDTFMVSSAAPTETADSSFGLTSESIPGPTSGVLKRQAIEDPVEPFQSTGVITPVAATPLVGTSLAVPTTMGEIWEAGSGGSLTPSPFAIPTGLPDQPPIIG